MRSSQAFGMSVCVLLAGQFGCSSSDEGKSHDGSPDLIELMDKPMVPDKPGQPDASIDSTPDLIELADKPSVPDNAKPMDSSPDLIELVDKPALPDGLVRVDGAKDLNELADGERVSVDGAIDSSPIDGSSIDQTTEAHVDGAAGEARANPCAACTANQICVQNNDGICHTTAFCKTVSDGCRNKLATSGAKSCTSLSECESEFCSQPYRCVYSIPCGNEIPEAAVYCYGP